jgi:hypothetical protein
MRLELGAALVLGSLVLMLLSFVPRWRDDGYRQG